MKTPVVVGVDLGGTWLRVVVLRGDGRRLRCLRERAPSVADLPSALRQLWRRWGYDPSDVRALVVAARGVWTPRDREIQAHRLRGLAVEVRVISDAEAAYLGALGSRPGILLLAGTGSIALVHNTRGRWLRRGGLGPLLGDEGSAFWIGREYLRARRAGDARLRRILQSPDAVARIARLAVRVLNRAARGDRRAQAIVEGAQQHLAALATEVARAARLPSPAPLSWAGRLLERPGFRAAVWSRVRAAGLRIRPIPPRESPALAAARLALTEDRGGRAPR